MQVQKVIKVGNSLAVTIPSDLALQLRMDAGDLVVPKKTKKGVAFEPVDNKGGITPEFRKWLTSFKDHYGPALKELAKK